MDAAQPQVRWVLKTSLFAGASAFLLGTTVLAGWWFGVRAIAQPVPALPGMVPNTAFWFVLLGTSILLLRRRNIHPAGHRLAQALAIVVIVIAGATLAEALFGGNWGVGQVVMRVMLDVGTFSPPGASAPGTAAAFVMLALALLTLDIRPAVRLNLSELLAGGATLIALLALAGYLYGATPLYGATDVPHIGIAPHTTLGIFILTAGILCLRPERPLIGLLTSTRAGGMAVRRLMVGVWAIPASGLLVMLGLRGSLYGQPFAEALLAVIAMAIAVGLVLATGRTLDRLDDARTVSERAVAEREERLRDLIEQASDGVFIADLEGRYAEVNDAGCKMLGYRRDEIVAKTILDLIPATDIPRLELAMAALLKGGTHLDEWTLTRRDGTHLPVEVNSKILPDGRWQALVRDISARRDAERASEAVAESATGSAQSSVQAVLRTVVLEAQLAGDAEYVAVGAGGDATRTFEQWVSVGMPPERVAAIGRSPRPVGLLGFAIAQGRTIRVPDLRRHPAFAGFPPDHPQMTSFLAVPIRSRGRAIAHLYLANKRGAAEFTVADERAVERIAARAGPIIETARLYQLEGLQRAWLQATIDQMPEGVILVDATGATQVENRAIQAFTYDIGQRDRMGHPERYDLRLPNGEPVPPDDRPGARALIDGVTTMRQNFLLRHPDGRMVPMLVSAAPVFDAEGALSGAVMIYQDISTIKELERMREEWSSLVAHDLRQPLGVILIDADALTRMTEHTPAEESQKVIERIRRSARRLNKMIDDLLDVSLIEGRHLRLERSPVELASWLDDAIERLSLLAPGHPVRFMTQVRPAPALIDPARIEQVLGNLISNAAKYGEREAEITIGLTQQGAEFEVATTSRGRGILPADLANLFQRFTRSETARGGGVPGLGLGLYICKGLVEAHGGRIRAESVPGETTTFYFTIPVHLHAAHL